LPSFAGTPAQLAASGADAFFAPARFTADHARLTLTGASATVGPGTGDPYAVTSPTLDRIRRTDKITEDNYSAQRFQLIWQRQCEAIEAAFAALTSQVSSNSSLLSAIVAAQTLAQAANESATAVSESVNLSESYTDPALTLSAASNGTVTIAAHNRVYGNTTVAVDGGSVSGFAEGAYVAIYYVDAAREGGAVTYQGTTSAVAQSGNVHTLGQVTIPLSGDPPVSGGTASPGYTLPSDLTTFDPDYLEP
jgi:hypothetical protein